MNRSNLLVVCAIAISVAAPARAEEPAPGIELYTMGPGDELFSAFGHAAICVRDARSPAGRCYNYGTADFRTPVPLTWDFIRGRARFWVSVLDLPTLLYLYRREDRSVWRQTLTLPPDEARALAVALEASTDEKVKYYRYHHFNDNCTTRIRDLVDLATGGALRKPPLTEGRSFRAWAREGFRGNWPLLAVTELVLGRSADRASDSWTAMFLPSELRAEVARRFGAQPVQVVARHRPLPGGSAWLGQLAFTLAGLALALLVAIGARLGGRWRRVFLVLPAFLLGLTGTVLWALAILSSFPELTWNEALLAFWPSDFALLALSPPLLRRYARVRLGAIALVVIAHLVVFTQPLAPLLFAVLPLGAMLAFDAP
jgi:hypothetical protein